MISDPTIDLIRAIGSPFQDARVSAEPERMSAELLQHAFVNRIPALYLERTLEGDSPPGSMDLAGKLRERASKTHDVLVRLAERLNEWDSEGYVIFKSIKPYPGTPNDTDVLILGDRAKFEDSLTYLQESGYVFHEWAPLQTTFYDPRGKSHVGPGKKGGIYYIDIYREISTDYVTYLDKAALLQHIRTVDVDGVDVRLLAPEAELAIILFHNLVPERTFQLEHFYMPLYSIAEPSFQRSKFISFVKQNHLQYAVATSLGLVGQLHSKAFGFAPAELRELDAVGPPNPRESRALARRDFQVPHMFSRVTFIQCLIGKLQDPVFVSSLMSQALHMLNPVFFIDVIRSVSRRFSETGTYHAE